APRPVVAAPSGADLAAPRLGGAGAPAADLLVGRIGSLPAAVARLDRQHAVDVEEDRFGAPEAAAGKDRGLDVRGLGVHAISVSKRSSKARRYSSPAPVVSAAPRASSAMVSASSLRPARRACGES